LAGTATRLHRVAAHAARPSRQDRLVGGMLGGLAARWGIAPLWLRLGWLAAFALLEPVRFQLMGAYVVLWAITPPAAAARRHGTWTRA
jgi:phage shock protein PspC (stress-responsive transcriptional regulator)